MTREGISSEKSSGQAMSARVVVGMAHSKADSGDWKSKGYALIGVVPNGLFKGFFETPEAARAELISNGWEEVHSNVQAAWELPLRQDELSEGLPERREQRQRRAFSVQTYVARAFSEDGIRLYEIIVYDEHGHALPAHEQPMRPFLIIEGGRVVLAMTKAEATAGFKHYCEMIKGRNLKSGFSNKFK
ncbi:hypothetical protein ISN36_09220 [Xanthomonas translucens pv. undulosa]|uniref:hypothetical protein n=1 Tax=Xanthomonas campestris pv. translucens TaxID=343 RepID=UPI0019D6EC24|nr:hypothetical protein [Xanthomonas translucens]QSQ54334.1 hypothetical protein ISN36_09220 [Xanthomonas translucens pv. undulosa]QSQ60045.1 hypothetical protein ISN38_18520 [Xanthomonas translucens pv. undulosa]